MHINHEAHLHNTKRVAFPPAKSSSVGNTKAFGLLDGDFEHPSTLLALKRRNDARLRPQLRHDDIHEDLTLFTAIVTQDCVPVFGVIFTVLSLILTTSTIMRDNKNNIKMNIISN